ncbi:abhydrolase domain-containing protein 11 [biofilm metagenome]
MEPVELAYDEFAEQRSVPLIILHGFFASSRNWRRIAESLSDSFHVYVLDMRNHGNSPHTEIMDYPTMMADVLRFMDGHHLANAHILGHSMGGKVAMWLALNHPERMGKLIVVDIAPKGYSHSFDKTIKALMALPLGQIQNRKQAEEWLINEIPEVSYRQFLLQNLIMKDKVYTWRIDLGLFMQVAPYIVAFPETENLLPYQGETLFLAGGNSEYVKQNDTLPLFPKALFKEIDNAGHWLHVQQPEFFLLEVEKFLKL